MGTINYGTSNYITMGLNPLTAWDIENDAYLIEELKEEIEEYGGTLDEAIRTYCNDTNEQDYHNVTAELEKHSFYYFHVTIKSGYYEGFYVDIENNFPVCFDDYRERKEALKEVREIQNFLTGLANIGIVSVFPGWCTTYRNRKETLKDIRKAAQEMREEVRNTPTWRQYTAA